MFFFKKLHEHIIRNILMYRTLQPQRNQTCLDRNVSSILVCEYKIIVDDIQTTLKSTPWDCSNSPGNCPSQKVVEVCPKPSISGCRAGSESISSRCWWCQRWQSNYPLKYLAGNSSISNSTRRSNRCLFQIPLLWSRNSIHQLPSACELDSFFCGVIFPTTPQFNMTLAKGHLNV